MGILLILLSILITLGGLTPLIIGIAGGKKSPAAESVIILKKVFAFAGLPCLMLSATVVTVEFFVNGEGISKRVIIALCTALSALVSFATNIRQCMPYLSYSGLREARTEHKAAFEFIGAWNEAITMNRAEHGSFSNFAAETAARLNALCDQIDGYMAFQKEHCLSLLEKRSDCENIFARLSKAAEKCTASFSAFHRRLNAANASLLYFYESGSIENEMRTSLVNELRQRSNELDRQIQRILSKLEMMEFKTSKFADFAKPYGQILGIYSTRIESTLDNIDKINTVKGNLAEIITLTLEAARVFKNGTDAFRHEAEAKIQAAREEATKSAVRVLEAEVRANAAEVKVRDAEAEAAAAKELAKAISQAAKQAKNKEHQALRRKYRTFFAISVTVIIISIGIGINEYKDIENLYDSLETKYDNLLNRYNKSKDIWEINVTSLKVGNADKNNKWITRPGEPLNAEDVRFLNPYLMVNSLISGNRTFYVKIIEPDGTIKRTPPASPEGYTFLQVRYLTIGKNQDVDLNGWGSGDQSAYAAGTYTIEVWYEGVQLITEKITLH
jgi:hypothetical protein